MNYASRPWAKMYPVGVPANIDPDSHQNLVEFFEEYLVKYADLPAFENMGKVITYRELDKYSRDFAAYLHSRGLEPGDRFAIMMPNCLQYPIAIIGALRAGLVLVNTNPLYTPREMLYQFNDSRVKGILIIENFANNLQQIINETSISTIIIANLGEMLGSVKGFVVNMVVKYVKRMVPKYDLPNTATFKEALKSGKKWTIKPFENKPENVIIHQYTGGTTGVSKGAMLTNRNMVANLNQMRAFMNVCLKEREEINLNPLPLYHIFAFTVTGLAMTTFGGKSVLVTNPRDIKSLLSEFKRNKITVMSGLNTLYNAMLNHPDFESCDKSSLKMAVAGGMAMQLAVSERWEKATGVKIAEGFGMTETSPVVTVNPLDGTARLGSIGIPVPSTDVRIVDEDGNDVPVGERGEMIVKGPQVMAGYFEKPEETAQSIKGEWLYTGDVAVMEPDGFFRIVDRKKDMILVSGFNVYPNEIEEEVMKHPKVLEAAALGIPDEKSGEVVKIYVVKKDPSLTKEEMIAYCKTCMTAYKVPREVEFRDELPKTNVGKILRRKLREG